MFPFVHSINSYAFNLLSSREWSPLNYLWILFLITAISVVLGAPPILVQILQNVVAWSPTFALLILFKSFYPNQHLIPHIKSKFKGKIRISHLFISLFFQALIVVVAIILFNIFENKPILFFPFKEGLIIFFLFIINLTSGPLGEELGWRGFALQTLQKNHSPLISALILGVIWGFWHTPLWFIAGFSGIELITYIIAFLISIISTSVIITYFYNKSNNLLLPIWIHFWFNFLLNIFNFSSTEFLQIFIYIAKGYAIFALLLIIVKKEDFFQKIMNFQSNKEL